MAERREHVVHVMPPALRPLVAFATGYAESGVPPAVHRGLPSPYLTVILTLDEPCHVAVHPDPAQPAGSFATLVGGLHTRPATVVHDGAQSGVQLAMTPLGARALLGVRAGELGHADLDGEQVPAALAGLAERLRAASGWAERFAFLDGELGRRWERAASRGGVRAAELPPVAVRAAWASLLRTGGTIGVEDLAREVGTPARRLRALFDAEVGLSPKQAARVVRFDRARRLLQDRPGARLADVAATCGYYDQPHLDAEFRALAGAPPSRWLDDEGRNLQGPGADALAVSSA